MMNRLRREFLAGWLLGLSSAAFLGFGLFHVLRFGHNLDNEGSWGVIQVGCAVVLFAGSVLLVRRLRNGPG